MASVDKTSVRNEVSRLKAEFTQLCADGKITSESSVLMNSLFMILELILALFLEKTTKKNSKNSSKPSSQTQKDDSSLPQRGSHGKGKDENNALAIHTRVKESVRVSRVRQCDVCGEILETVPCLHTQRRTKIDIVFEKVVEHVEAEVKQCPTCAATVKGRFPSDMHGPLQYGDGLKAFVINLVIAQMVALHRVQKLVNAMFGLLISQASVLNYILQLHAALADWEHRATAQLLKAPSLHVDETSCRVDKKNHWIHVYSAGDITLKFLHRKRGTEAITSMDIIPRYGGVLIHDCWSSYLSYAHCAHGLCGSHLLRELTFVVESNNYAWARHMKRLLQETCVTVSNSTQKSLTDNAFAKVQQRYRTILTRGETELPPIPPKPDGKRGRLAKSDAHNLLERLQMYESSVLLFAKNPHVAFTNNRAERDLRMAKVKQKVSGCFRAEVFAQAYCRISSYLQTMASKGYNPLVAIQMALAGELEG
ncbi:MAG: IS66 family transposase [Patescibacteria group bacterium]